MNEAKAVLKNYRQSPRKVRLVADIVRGKNIAEALTMLSFIPKRSALPLQKLLASALANAGSVPKENLIVKEIKVDSGPTLFRRRPRSRGSSNPIKKRTSHVSIVLGESKAKNKQLTAKS
ncbi:MAG: 50S ribosomal protein L22 [Parcubacteria group bacterium GW2011_GWB1_38_8]|uniref:Large ribosomal subunit protein uL22 n=1 Tax=Candidatus Zambryskibacteria bacterium RIFCSPLOWO2_02_FULL_39_14 TaxID=1802769 RepID=A0A1G2UIT2_9BACT|nr:MAG: 50S ribosomal protein L22 [Parcubacteria group bacterium GW2011_GWB1_38_8]KKR30899.1 MAG: 50S ribosomal protein L22 [Parcubacteria group bacterium GW2011_GWC1_39_8]OHA94762.1 MAG: 50S ribosomal protein L22 [Candidatus Zambryskibacteria bacterium RIFCSPHIGHO2_02_FULL_39_16]OHB09349.1 MAG: 50S ribosomal protein L22 [Candidatus Zambryskibacteria bacterium RIFCSPLOWO2_02_FULL_39_14]